jgi:hypothetical protein
LAECQSAVVVNPQNPSTHLHLARLRVEAGDCAGARPELEAVEAFVKAEAAIQNARLVLQARCQNQPGATAVRAPAAGSSGAGSSGGQMRESPAVPAAAASRAAPSAPPGADGATPRWVPSRSSGQPATTAPVVR